MARPVLGTPLPSPARLTHPIWEISAQAGATAVFDLLEPSLGRYLARPA